jgi:hypothetical protein
VTRTVPSALIRPAAGLAWTSSESAHWQGRPCPGPCHCPHTGSGPSLSLTRRLQRPEAAAGARDQGLMIASRTPRRLGLGLGLGGPGPWHRDVCSVGGSSMLGPTYLDGTDLACS